ncbi:uncharacterized protein LTR77_008310 [Saxophila tyrrhenica]|uniref:SnoaL-like domain-containing protein n=1 Tax=Saxophila tyrrhenica TaxID=1690608 RepID=A0AAV9P2I4_9PEZI|nr:hypothetical protein LTR77_008310 [Saxophila tyrrhenica]
MKSNGSARSFNQDHFILTAHRMAKEWSTPLSDLSHADFLKIYSKDVDWFDHAFLIHRKGHVGVEMLRERWLTTNQPYSVTVTDVHPTTNGAIMEGFAEGVFAKALYSIQPTGKAFTYALMIRLQFDERTGLIQRVDEYYTRNWDSSVPTARYKVDDSRANAEGLPSS